MRKAGDVFSVTIDSAEVDGAFDRAPDFVPPVAISIELGAWNQDLVKQNWRIYEIRVLDLANAGP